MKLASYKDTRSGFKGLANILIRIRTGSEYSHNEVMFEPGDGVDHLMPDGTTEPSADGALWMASSSMTDIMPQYCPNRPGGFGGIRFKRIVPDGSKWDVVEYPKDPIAAATYFKDHQGDPYDHSLIMGYVLWFLNLTIRKVYLKLVKWVYKKEPSICSQVCLACTGFNRASTYDPGQAHDIVSNLK